MPIKIEKKERSLRWAKPADGWSYIRFSGQLRDDLKRIAIWSNKGMQEVGEEILRQAVTEVLQNIDKIDAPHKRKKRNPFDD